MNAGSLISKALTVDPPTVMAWIEIGSAIVQVVMTAGLLEHQRRLRANALRNDSDVGVYIFTPFHWQLFVMTAAADLCMGIAYLVILVTNVLDQVTSFVAFAGRITVMFSSSLITIFLMQQAMGVWAIRRSILAAIIVVAVHSGSEAASVAIQDSHQQLSAVLPVHFTMAILYLFVGTTLCHKRIFRRPAVFVYARFWSLFYFVSSMGDTFALIGLNNLVYPTATLLFCLFQFKAWITYKTLERDSRYWHGTEEGVSFRSYFGAFGERQLSANSVDVLANAVEGLRSDPSVHMISYAHLKVSELELGSGSQARVYLGRYRKQQVAVKLYVCLRLTREVVEGFSDEVSALSSINSPYLVKVYGVCVLPPNVCYVMEYCSNGSLRSWLNKNPNMSWRDRVRVGYECAEALAALHFHSYLHQDLKADNYLVASNGTVKMCDLGLARKTKVQYCAHIHPDDHQRYGDEALSDDLTLPEFGTLPWMAPELLRGSNHLHFGPSPKSDVFALCTVLWEVVSGKLPFDTPAANEASPLELARVIVSQSPEPTMSPFPPKPSDVDRFGAYRGRPAMPLNVPEPLASLIVSGWVADPQARPNAADLASQLAALGNASFMASYSQ